MGISLRQTDSADRLPPTPRDGRPAPYTRPSVEPAVVLFGGAFVLLLLVVAVPILWWLFGADLRDWLRYGDGAWVVRVLLGLGLVALAGKVVRGIVFIRVRDIPIASHSLARTDAGAVLAGLLTVDAEYARAVTPAQITYSPTAQNRSETTAAPALAAPEPSIALVPDVEWRRWIGRAPHLLIAGRTDAGKTTLMEAILNERAAAGDDILILDPHYQPGKWCGLPAVGGGNSFEAILDMLPRVLLDMDARYKEFEAGRPTEDFQRLTILVDEAPALVDYCIELTPSGRPKIKDMRWPRFAKRLGSEARKVRISVILGAQSTIVTDLLINSQMRENYLRIGLGDRARPLIHEEPNQKRRSQLDDLLRGQAHPAAMEWRGDFHLLDTNAIPDLAARRVPSAALWTPPAVEQPTYRPATVAQARDDGTVRASVKVPASVRQERLEVYITALVKQGKTREQIRAWTDSQGLRWDNEVLTKVRRDLGLSVRGSANRR